MAEAKQLCQNRHTRLIRQIGYNDQGLRQLVVIVSSRVGLQNVNVRRCGELLQHGPGVARIDLQGVQRSRLLGQGGGENAAARADFQRRLAGGEGSALHDFVDH